MKYNIGDKIYMSDGYVGVIVEIQMKEFPKWKYVVKDKHDSELPFDTDYFDENTFSEKEWKGSQRYKNFKFKVGDKILIPYLYPSSTVYDVVELKENSYTLSTTFNGRFGMAGSDLASYPKVIVEKYGELHVEKKQYAPSNGECYFYTDLADSNLYSVTEWSNRQRDYHLLKLGLIKETPQECVKLAKEMLKKLDLEV